MTTRLILLATVGGRRLEVTEHFVGTVDLYGRAPRVYYNCGPDERPVSWRLEGRKVRDGSLIGADTEANAIHRAIHGARKHSPKARIHVSYCALCGVGRDEQQTECRHVRGR